MGQRDGGAASASEASDSRAPIPPVEADPPRAELVPKLTRPKLNALARDAYHGDVGALSALSLLSPAEKHYLATRPEFQHFVIALMFDAVIGNERVSKQQRAAAAWFHRVIKDHSAEEGERKRGRIPEGAQVTDAAGGDDE